MNSNLELLDSDEILLACSSSSTINYMKRAIERCEDYAHYLNKYDYDDFKGVIEDFESIIHSKYDIRFQHPKAHMVACLVLALNKFQQYDILKKFIRNDDRGFALEIGLARYVMEKLKWGN